MTRYPLKAEDFVDTPFPRDYWRAYDNFVLSSLVLCCETPMYVAIDWEKICETLQERTNTEFKPGYLNALVKYGVLEGFIVRVYMNDNEEIGTRAEIGPLIRDIFYLKFLKYEGPTLRRVLATYDVWQDALADVEEKRLPVSAAIALGKEAAEKIREAMAFKCPCEPIVIGEWWREISIDDETVKPVPEEVILELLEEEKRLKGSGAASENVENVAEELATLSTADKCLEDDSIAEQEACGSGKGKGDTAVIAGSASERRPVIKPKSHKEWCKTRKTLLSLLEIASEHRHSSIFRRPMDKDPIYGKVVRHPVCLNDIGRDIRNGQIGTIPALRERLVLMFNNAFFSNPVSDPLYERMVSMCVDVMEAFDERVAFLKAD
ncbi:Bromodomain domain containing protein [Trichuris trichiura]|uniref:Bromodomain domain containing protein n=1 Tax=Trichuris trichiura TaxID=36087 RepID=A0A077Z6T1_TRITR|nr:Bromodomain domain containing protein [Trichuris trichiura]